MNRMRSLNVNLGSNFREQWDAYCAAIGEPPSGYAAKVLKQTLAEARRTGQIEATSKAPPRCNAVGRVRREIRFTENEAEGISAYAEKTGVSFQMFVISAVRATLTGDPQFGEDETRALWESNYQLQAIGRNLNQLVKRFHEQLTPPTTGQVKAVSGEIEKLTGAIVAHTKKVNSLAAANLQRWKVE
jgi:hypothetical protein